MIVSKYSKLTQNAYSAYNIFSRKGQTCDISLIKINVKFTFSIQSAYNLSSNTPFKMIITTSTE